MMRLLLFLYPWLELLSIIQLGVETSALTAVAWVVAMLLLGSAMLRHVGTASLTRLRTAQQTGILQQHLLVDDMAVVVAALLFIVPGLLSDAFALIVLVGPLRRALARVLLGRSRDPQGFGVDISAHYSSDHQDGQPGTGTRRGPHRPDGAHSHAPKHTETLEGDYERVDDGASSQPPSDR